MNITETLISWYRHNRRDLPWRNTRNPYYIWLSEVILQQTRVNQGMDYYIRFTERFPDVHSLAAAPEEEVLKLWQGLGYYSRARNLHHAARTVVEKYNGLFPSTYAEIITLKGIGDYTAAAIASISFGEVKPVVDGNVARVLSRLYALEEAVDSPTGKKSLLNIARELIDHNDPATFNQAMMEFGALLCKPQRPDCETCPLQPVCLAFQQKRVPDFPVKQSRTIVKELYFYYLVIRFNFQGETHILLNHRNSKGIWRNLYDFPLVESGSELSLDAVLSAEWPQRIIESGSEITRISPEYIHILSHRRLVTRFINIQLSCPPASIESFIAVPVSGLAKYPVPRLIERYLHNEKILPFKEMNSNA